MLQWLIYPSKYMKKKNFRFYKEHLKQLNKDKNKTKSVIGKNVLQRVKQIKK